MSTDRPHVTAASARAIDESNDNRSFLSLCGKAAFWVPAFIWILGIYFVMAQYVVDVRASIFQVGSFAISWIEILYVVAFAGAMNEITKVIKPGDDNTNQALLMTAVGVLYVVLFTISVVVLAFGVDTPLAVFATSEFVILILFSWVQTVLSFRINSATLKRTFANADE